MRYARNLCLIMVLVIMNTEAFSQTVPAGFTVETVNSSLDGDAVGFAFLPDGRILVAHQFSGELQLMVNGTLKATPILTVPDLRTGSERGFLGIAVDPAWPDSNYVYTYHTTDDDSNRVSRFPVTGDLSDSNSENLSINPSNLDTLLSMTDVASNHNGGTLRFGSDSTLYVSLGDDANTGLVQNLSTLHGKIIRINRDGSAPADNPYVDSIGALPEIFAIGLRNPFRFNIDPETDQLLIGDVGQNSWEEVDLAVGGENFGWPRYEGDKHTYQGGATLITSDTTWPIYEYPQVSGRYSVIGLLTYRQKAFPSDNSFPDEYHGAHFFADYYNSRPIFSLRPDQYGAWVADTFATGFSQPVDAALGDDGSFYLLEYGSTLSKIKYDPGPTVTLNAKVFLEGPYGVGEMDTTLNSAGYVPLFQPYADSVYDGTNLEFDSTVSVASVPDSAVDWVLASLRSTTFPGSEVSTRVGFLKLNGDLAAIDGSSGLAFPMVDSLSYYVVIRHRNHASIMSSAAVDFSSGVGTWDFSTGLSQAYSSGGVQMQALGDGNFGMFAGDADIDGQFTASDFNAWLIATKSILTGYVNTDFSLDGQVVASDFNIWLVNTKAIRTSQVPE